MQHPCKSYKINTIPTPKGKPPNIQSKENNSQMAPHSSAPACSICVAVKNSPFQEAAMI
jgi:hypothetical protein